MRFLLLVPLFIVSLVVAAQAASPSSATASPGISASVPAADLEFLRSLTSAVVEASRVKPGTRVGGAPTNTCGFTLIMPGGRGGYPAFWVRDFAMSLESGMISPEEMRSHLRLVARCQNGPVERNLRNGLVIPPFAIPDHINFDGTAVFYPGTYSSGDDQGRGDYGILPPVDDHFEFIHLAHCLFRATGETNFLGETVEGMTLFRRLETAFDAPTTDPRTGLVRTSPDRRAVGFGFCDAIYLTGDLLFPSLLRYRAAGQMSEISMALGQPEAASRFRQIQTLIRDHLIATFGESNRIGGWLKAATGVGQQPDVWGTLYALHLGVLQGAPAEGAVRSVIDAVRKKTLLFEGAVRHVPMDFDYSADSAWERTAGVRVNTYQNGAYWHTPTGWLIRAVERRDRALASQLASDYLQHLRQHDFRRGPDQRAPWECLGPNGYAQNGVYMTSVTLPLAVLSRSGSAQR